VKDRAMEFYHEMARIRCFEEEVRRRFRRGELPGWQILYDGEEAIAVGICLALQDGDQVFGTHRGHGYSITKGVDMRQMAAEFHGYANGICKGLGNPFHISHTEKGITTGGIVGGTIPLATGAALAFSMQGQSNVAVTFFGDGASNQGVFHECLNMASLWKLPVVYVCENNGYGEMTPIEHVTTVPDLSDHGKLYGMPSMTIDGNDVELVYATGLEAAERARGGGGATLIECVTRRWAGAYEGDQQKYIPSDEMDTWRRQNDPIRILGERLLSREEATQDDLDSILHGATKEVHDAFADLPDNSHLTREDLELLTYSHRSRRVSTERSPM
jgi:TPP-dependent pyruvate/acetoin dehydrogenase alpha subunit